MSDVECPRPHILVVDDEPSITAMLEYILTAAGYAVTRASDGMEALDRIAGSAPDLVLLDLDMPRLGGFDVCRQIKSTPSLRFIPVVILTGRDASEARLRAWDLGADDFLNKPFQAVDVVARCRSLIRVKELVSELDSAHSVVFALARAIEAKSRFTQGHTERVTVYALALAARLGVSDKERKTLEHGAALHDIGKIAVPDVILNKPGPLTPEEYAIIKTHPLEGVRIVEPLRSTRDAIPIIRWHHERLDGKGYPDGRKGDAIPLLPRLLAVADVYDALSSDRPYRPAMPLERCLRILQEEAAGGGLDPELVRLFCEAPAIPLTDLFGNADNTRDRRESASSREGFAANGTTQRPHGDLVLKNPRV
jgi:putative two-component system response regulator